VVALSVCVRSSLIVLVVASILLTGPARESLRDEDPCWSDVELMLWPSRWTWGAELDVIHGIPISSDSILALDESR